MFRTIASFVKEAALGVAEMLGETFASTQSKANAGEQKTDPLARDAGAIAASAAYIEGSAPARISEIAPDVQTGTADAPPAPQAPFGDPSPPEFGGKTMPLPAPAARSPRAAKAAPRRRVASAVPAAPQDSEAGAAAVHSPVGKTMSGELAAAGSRSRVAARYQALKAQGLTAKEANDFSRSERKYALYLRLSSTRLSEGGKTHWEILKDFDAKAADELVRRKSSGVPAEEIVVFKKQIAAARMELIANYQADDGPGRENSFEVETVAKIIGLDCF